MSWNKVIGAIKILSVLLLIFCSIELNAQNGMNAREYNFTSFNIEKEFITPELIQNTSESFRHHPEFGIKPYKSQCEDCVELIQKRTIDSRYFIDPNSASHIYIQQSYFPLHFADDNGRFITIDPRLRPVPYQPGVYVSTQPEPGKYDFNSKVASLTIEDFEFRFNGNMHQYFLSKNLKTYPSVKANMSQSTIGEEGVLTREAWNKTNIEQIFSEDGIKTNYIIQQKLSFPEKEGWLIFEDEIELPAGYSIVKGENGYSTEEGFWVGELLVKNEKNQTRAQYNRPKYHDSYSNAIRGIYDLEKEAGKYKLKTLVPTSWLNDTSLAYPVYIDPQVIVGFDSIGAYNAAPGDRGAKLAFTQISLGSCDYTLDVNIQGGIILNNVRVSTEFRNSDSLCVPQPPAPTPFCVRTDLRQRVIGPCDSVTLQCQDSPPPWIGTCTTDPNKVGGMGYLTIPNFASCVQPPCDDYIITFTLKNISLRCLETCAYNCAIGSHFAITVEGKTMENVAQAKVPGGNVLTIADTICAGEPVNLISFPAFGVPPYVDYIWTPGGLRDSIVTVYPETTTTYINTAFDTCGNSVSDTVVVNVISFPRASAGTSVSKCDGSSPFVIGGNPTGPPGASIQWSAIPSSATGFLSSLTDPNPFVAIPFGTTGSYQFIVTVSDFRCARYDTISVTIFENPVPLLLSDSVERICDGDEVKIAVAGTYSGYVWSNAETTSSITVTQGGNYSVIVTDANGCTGTSNTSQVISIPIFSAGVVPKDTSIETGNSVILSSTIDLSSPDVDTFFWSPAIAISCLDCRNPVVSPTEDQEYILTVISTDGCVATDSVKIKIILPDEYFIPTAFSPNQDGVNDVFFIIKASGVTLREFKIFNRWGEMIHNETIPWTGFHKGEAQPMGTYAYLMILNLFDGRVVKESGNVTLIR